MNTIVLARHIFLILVCLVSTTRRSVHAFTPLSTTTTAKRATKNTPSPPLHSTPIQSPTSPSSDERRSLLQNLLLLARTHGPIGIEDPSETARREILAVADRLRTHSVPDPASAALRGTHSLLYSLASLKADGGGPPRGSQSAGRIGPLVGAVTQEFDDGESFRNVVRLLGGSVRVVLDARRTVMDGERIRVEFRTVSLYIGGVRLVTKETKGSGIWKVLFVGEFEEDDGGRCLVRVMETPSLFVLVQKL